MMIHDKDDWFIVVQCGSDTLRDFAAQVSKTTRGQWKDRLFVWEEAQGKTIRLNFEDSQHEIFLFDVQF